MPRAEGCHPERVTHTHTHTHTRQKDEAACPRRAGGSHPDPAGSTPQIGCGSRRGCAFPSFLSLGGGVLKALRRGAAAVRPALRCLPPPERNPRFAAPAGPGRGSVAPPGPPRERDSRGGRREGARSSAGGDRCERRRRDGDGVFGRNGPAGGPGGAEVGGVCTPFPGALGVNGAGQGFDLSYPKR